MKASREQVIEYNLQVAALATAQAKACTLYACYPNER